MALAKEYRRLSLSELKQKQMVGDLPVSIALANYAISKDEQLLVNINEDIQNIFKKNHSDDLIQYLLELSKNLPLKFLPGVMKEIYLSVNSNKTIKESILSFALEYQYSISSFIGYFYEKDIDIDFFLKHIKCVVENNELKKLVLESCITRQDKKRVLLSGFIDLSPLELIHFTDDQILINEYVKSIQPIEDSSLKELFEQIIKNK